MPSPASTTAVRTNLSQVRADLTNLVVWPCGQFQVNQTWSLPV